VVRPRALGSSVVRRRALVSSVLHRRVLVYSSVVLKFPELQGRLVDGEIGGQTADKGRAAFSALQPETAEMKSVRGQSPVRVSSTL
jgi:hypothetical protein